MTRHVRNGITLVAIGAASAAALWLAGRGALAAPHAWGPRAWTDLVADRGAIAAAMTIARLAGLACSAYLVLVGVLTVAAHASGLALVRWLAAAITPRVLRPLLGLATVITLAAPGMAGAAENTPPPVMILVTTTTAPTPATTAIAPPSAPPTMRRVPAAPTTTPSTTTAPPTTRPTPAPTTTTAPPAGATTRISAAGAATSTSVDRLAPTISAPTPATPATWTVQRGDHLWHIARATLHAGTGHDPSDRETDAYWRTLIAANRDRLVQPDNPDLLHAGQELLLPPTR